MHRTIQILRKILSVLLFILLPLAVVTLITSKTGVLGGVRSFTVASGSMAPALPVGSVIYTIKQPNYSLGQVVAVQENGVTVTHRINKTLGSNNDSFELKGDANKDPDSKPVLLSQIIGKEFLMIPFIGKLSVLMKTPLGFLFLIILPSFVFIALEILSIKKELEIQIEKKLKSKLGISTGVAILASVMFMSSYATTYSFFSNSGQSTNNVFVAAQSFGPNPGDVVINEVFAGGSSTTEWVELLNKTSSPKDISGWTIKDNTSSDTIPASTVIPANGFAVIVAPSSTVSIPGSALSIVLSGPIGGGLSTSGDRLTLTAQPSATIIDSLSWGTDITILNPAAAAQGTGQSLARIPNGVDTNVAGDWALDSTPTVGVANAL